MWTLIRALLHSSPLLPKRCRSRGVFCQERSFVSALFLERPSYLHGLIYVGFPRTKLFPFKKMYYIALMHSLIFQTFADQMVLSERKKTLFLLFLWKTIQICYHTLENVRTMYTLCVMHIRVCTVLYLTA